MFWLTFNIRCDIIFDTEYPLRRPLSRTQFSHSSFAALPPTFAPQPTTKPPIMKVATRLPMRLAPRLVNAPVFLRPIHSTVAKPANVAPIVGTGPPPAPPEPPTAAEVNVHQRVARRRKQAEMLKHAKEIRSVSAGKTGTLTKRFWKDVAVKEVDGELRHGSPSPMAAAGQQLRIIWQLANQDN